MWAVVGVVTRSTRTSAAPPSPMTWVSTWIPLGRREGRLGLSGAGRVVAVGQQDDPLLGVVREERGGKPHRARRCPSPPSTGTDAIVSSSRTSAGRRSTRASLPNATMPARSSGASRRGTSRTKSSASVAARLADQIGQVDDEHRGQPIDRQDDLEPGEGEGERGQHERPDRERRPPPERADPPSRAEVEQERQGEQDRQRARGRSGR